MKKYRSSKLPPKDVLPDRQDIERRMLFRRNLKTEEEAEKFLNISYERDTNDPFLMTGMKEAVSRILKAMESGEHIAVFGDFDADGLCASVCWQDFFRRAGYQNYSFYIPHRHEEGFGVSREALFELLKKGVSLVITVDCGVADGEALEEATEAGLDIIVTDHHEPVNGLPQVFAVLDPKRKDCSYPDPDLSGAGVAFKLIQGLLSKERFGIPEGHEKWLLDLVGIATISDSVPLLGENRVLARYGLLVLRKSPRVGIMKLCRKLNLSQSDLTEDDIGFMIAPRLNAASRMGEVADAFTLLATEDEAEAERAVSGLEKLNNERKGVVAAMVKDVKQNKTSLQENDVIVTGNPKWRPSLLGLVANSLAEEFSKPVFLWGRDGANNIKGSCRSGGGVDLLALMSHAEGFFEQYGGHRFAGGFSVRFEDIHKLREGLNEAYSKNGIKAEYEEVLVDGVLSLSDVNDRFYNTIERFSPFGVGNPKPVFKFAGVFIKEVRLFGKQKEHLEIILADEKGVKVKAIGFFLKPQDLEKDPKEGDQVTVIATLERSFFRGRSELRLRLVDVLSVRS
ncbi:MAG: single-stranded-DNA-specific exonuclease RecJ [Candidatus Paceibacterota bacterium]